MAVGIVERGRRRVIVYGKQDSGDSRSVAANTLFEIGSLTKVFTALLLADMVHRKELQFDDPVDRSRRVAVAILSAPSAPSSRSELIEKTSTQ